jgi:hypothetical protein
MVELEIESHWDGSLSLLFQVRELQINVPHRQPDDPCRKVYFIKWKNRERSWQEIVQFWKQTQQISSRDIKPGLSSSVFFHPPG